MTTAYLGGTFDLLHIGHLRLFAEARRLVGPDGKVVVALNRDEFVQRYKGITPTHPYDERRKMLRSLRDVDAVVENIGDEDSKTSILWVYPRPTFIVIGSDWRDRDYYVQMGFTQEWLDAYGMYVIYVPLLEGHSSTRIREALHDDWTYQRPNTPE